MDHVDAVVIGAGVVGLAIARALALRGLDTVVLEREATVGAGISSRNSEVIHAGLYYPVGSLKARLCVEGRERLYDFCRSHGVAHRRCGKLVVAVDDRQRDQLEGLKAKACANGVTDVELRDEPSALSMEPQLRCTGALWSPSTGIVDSHGLMLAIQGDLEAAGGVVVLRTEVESIEATAGAHAVRLTGDPTTLLGARIVVNASGLGAVALAKRIERLRPDLIPTAHLCKGNYFSLTGRSPFTRLVYPLPQDAWLGVHLTLDLSGQARFGPDVEWLPDDPSEPPDYRVDAKRAVGFYADIRRYWPNLPDGALQPAYSGIRPKIHGADQPAPDFIVQGPDDHQVPGLVNLFGIESPGLTSSLALADEVLRRLQV